MQLAPTRTHDDPKRQRQTPRTPNALPENHRESEMTTGRAGEQASKQAVLDSLRFRFRRAFGAPSLLFGHTPGPIRRPRDAFASPHR
ncbi:hypothetical protein PMIN06_004819 [Paraphaeosphaeria minitans]|uniref:Uncharacterized protein n=1 Tax=Paraphaeosphaeria minitans TaxID=565426 RepID=A0A9P6GLH9_9PLEO|nr:hypothetical protein PMIN01_04329 [Paraphaeosphaeria minitans]